MKATEQNRNHEPTGTSIANAILEAANALRVAGVPDPRREANSLLAHVLGKDRTFIISHATDELDVLTLEIYGELIRRRATGEPQQYITGTQSFYGLEFLVTPDVLIPRPETELLVEAALKLMDESQNTEQVICDIGTGSGCIAITLVHLRSKSSAVAIDISERALAVAKSNAHRHDVRHRMCFAVSNAFDALKPVTRFDLIVSNPPYVSAASLGGLQREVRDHEPLVALTPGGDGLSIIRRLLRESDRYLHAGGFLLFEIGFDQLKAVKEMIDKAIWKELAIQPDLQGIPRIIALQKKVVEPSK